MVYQSRRCILLLLILIIAVSSFQTFAQCSLPPPHKLKAKNITSCQFLVTWNLVSGAINYSLQYKEATASDWMVINNTGNVNSYLVTGVEANTSYEVKIAAICNLGETGTFTNSVQVITLGCTAPVNLTASDISATSATLTWSVVCNVPKFSIKYRKAGENAWTTINHIATASCSIRGLAANSTYEIKVQSKCDGSNSKYSPSIFFTTSLNKAGKNILLIIVDDSRFDSYTATGGPSFFNDVNISRIAQEGVSFTKAFAAFSLCAPSRATIITGLYPHINGITFNPTTDETLSNTTFPEILHSHGYFNGLIGKFHVSSLPQPGFDYWMETHANDYFDVKYNVNGIKKILPGHETDELTDSAMAFFHKVPDGQPFFLWLAYKAPHAPLEPRPEDTGIFDNFDMPFPGNFIKYSTDVPDFLYQCHAVGDSSFIEDYYPPYFELLNGVEVRLGDIFDELTAMGILDNTLIIFMSDNGYLLGEHQLIKKQLSYEESIQIPIFMRYPPLIAPGTIVDNQIAMNLDIAPTILDFAGIADTVGMQGISLLDLLNHSNSRKQMLYECYNDDCVPDIRSVRTLNYKYVEYYCNEPTEEFFDLVNDPHENNNIISNPTYTALVEVYRDKLAFLRNYYNDLSWDSLYDCALSNPTRLQYDAGQPLALLNTFPNPAASEIMVDFISSEQNTGTFEIINSFGQIVYRELIDDPYTEYSKSIGLEGIPAGNYFAVMQHGAFTYRKIFVKQ